jgi:hypothetical protein
VRTHYDFLDMRKVGVFSKVNDSDDGPSDSRGAGGGSSMSLKEVLGRVNKIRT